jgi:MbtH protein
MSESREEKARPEKIYKVVINHEEQYAIWPLDRELPQGWRNAGKSGSKAECLAFIEMVWVDMRPLNMRRRPDAQRRDQP